MVDNLVANQILKTAPVIRAFLSVDRADFVIPEYREKAYFDVALPIGLGQTISQPLTVAFMLELLSVEENQKILDIGAGSGWQTALLAEIVGPKGKVFALERIPAICQFGRENIGKCPNLLARIDYRCQDAGLGLEKEAPFDRIIAAAEARAVPKSWLDQLGSPGRMVVPRNGGLKIVSRDKKGRWKEGRIPGFVFVPFVSD